ncbi:hypothetical protein [Streptomyces cylindrosporus]|uniref:Uncharacterized protein n=1 Tax=Streptomyces cylindrosporus TaxID=2927583 RepID=A0ABS9YRK2_9ACTN|nr:hypothetical protein [Streptomyces cylindrosporus]MCI3278731.1 hypothetical protein [Streptomyces cylindrosporus]
MTAPDFLPGVRSVIGVDAGTVSLREADHLVHRLADELGLPAGTFACTHLIREGERRGTAISFAFEDSGEAEAAWRRLVRLGEPEAGAVLGGRECGPAEAVRAAGTAAGEHAGRRGGRAVLYPGVEHLTGTVTLGELLSLTAIDEATVVGRPSTPGQGPDPRTPVHTRDHVRPEWRGGRLVLALVPAAGDTLAPFEVPNPTPCCADHG